MAIIKKDKIVEKGVIDLKQENYAPAPSRTVQSSENILSDAGKADISEEKRSEDEHRLPVINEAPARMMDDAYEKASQITEKAQLEAQELIESAGQEADAIRENAKTQGLEEGKKAGEDHVAEYVGEALETLNNAIKERKKIIKDAESEMVRLSLKIAEQIVRSEISLHKDVVLNIVAEAINKIGDRENIIIKVNREDVDYIKQYKDKISGIVDGVKTLSILEDSQVEQGGCVIETHLGYVDARISTKLNLLEEALKKAE